VSVTEEVTLPAQPVSGQTKFVALAGNGWSAPQSAYAFQCTITGDASGGEAALTVRPDPQYAAIVSYSGMQSFNNAAAIGQLYRVVNGVETVVAQISPGHEVYGGINPSSASVWSPPLMVLDPPGDDPKIVLTMPNETGVTFAFCLRVYNFRKGVQNVTPLPVLVSALPRSVSSAP